MQEYSNQPRRRRRHSAQFKAQVLAACDQPGASVAGVALSFGLNANLVRQWRRGRGTQAMAALRDGQMQCAALPIVPLALAAPELSQTTAQPEAVIELQAQRGTLALTVRWPASSATACAALLRELLR